MARDKYASLTSNHVTLPTGGQPSVCLQHDGERENQAWVITRLFYEYAAEAISMPWSPTHALFFLYTFADIAYRKKKKENW